MSVNRHGKLEIAPNKSMDVSAKQRLFITVSFYPLLACCRFCATSSQPFGRFSLLFDSSVIERIKCYNRFGDNFMVTITFPDRETEKRALGFLLGRFSGRVLKSGEHLVPEAALEALADQNISFTVQGKSTYEQQIAAVRDTAPATI